MQSVHFENFPIKTAHFTSDGKQFLVGSQHFGHFFAYDMVKGMYWDWHSVKILEFCYIFSIFPIFNFRSNYSGTMEG